MIAHQVICPNVDMSLATRLADRVLAEPWLVEALDAVARSSLPHAWIGAGVVRDVVWGQLNGGFRPETVNDIDVVYLDRDDLRGERDLAAGQELAGLAAKPWEATNQAAVHTWYHHTFGGRPVPAFATIHDAVATWPETATCVAIRRADDGLDVCAPHGLEDLLNGVWRRNPARVSADYSRTRLARQNVEQRWPTIRVVG